MELPGAGLQLPWTAPIEPRACVVLTWEMQPGCQCQGNHSSLCHDQSHEILLSLNLTNCQLNRTRASMDIHTKNRPIGLKTDNQQCASVFSLSSPYELKTYGCQLVRRLGEFLTVINATKMIPALVFMVSFCFEYFVLCIIESSSNIRRCIASSFSGATAASLTDSD